MINPLVYNVNHKNNVEIDTLDIKHQRVSEAYKLVPTKDVINKFTSLGFIVDDYKAVKVKDASRRGYQKHFTRLSHPSMLSSRHSDVKLQLLLTNSHDGSSSFQLQLGIYRLVCSNGLVVGNTFETIRLRHAGNILEQIEPAVERMIAQLEHLDNAIDRMKMKTMTNAEIFNFYHHAVQVRYPDKRMLDVSVPINREADKGQDLFTVYNRVQEALIRGSSVSTTNNRRRQSRAITSIDKDKSINMALFDLAYGLVDAVA